MSLPFRIDRKIAKTFTMQIVDGFKKAIDAGFYPEGTLLPPRKELAGKLGVSECVVRSAMERIAAEGLIVGRPRIGFTVQKARPCGCFSSILVITSGVVGSYSSCVYEQAFQSVLIRAGYRPVPVPLGQERHVDYGTVRRALADKPDFVVIRTAKQHTREVTRLVSRAGVPYDIRRTPQDRTMASFRRKGRDYGGAVGDFVRACIRAKICSVWQCDFGRVTLMDAVPALRKSGISAERKSLLTGDWVDDLEAIQRQAAKAMSRLLDSGPLPDLLFFTDDYLTLGALPVLLSHGIRIPEDVCVVTLANRGFGPVFTKPFARIEVDSYRDGLRFGEDVLEWLRTGKPATDRPSNGAVYIPGETFPMKTTKGRSR